MEPLPLAHIGLLVRDVDEARRRWSSAIGLPFSPVTRYRPHNWSDIDNPTPHLSDARLTFCLGDHPSIEIIEFTGTGTHSPAKGEGGHHISFPPISDNDARRTELAELGIQPDGVIEHDGRLIFMFSDARALNNVFTEWVEEHPDHADVKDDLSPVDRLPDGSKTLFEPSTIQAVNGVRPTLPLTDIGVAVKDLSAAVREWEAVTSYQFDVDKSGESAIGTAPGAPTRFHLVVNGDPRRPEGLYEAVIEVGDLVAERNRLERESVPYRENPGLPRPTITIDRDYLNQFTLHLRQA
ncbi:VOC family protein [Tessaracoccus palaemonis]|uniref:VOC family protein n=1 Tax=Tessaracoccus palaemonis TaxID=2829499 RepID=A0ABX8SLG7_9ACTN|nr:VOC family protein [Tessaracoccus palaemonis]QXT63724.1 VOC family protein [Tessaracoccus palaemonis]